MDSSVRVSTHGKVLLLTLENPSGYPRLERDVLATLIQRVQFAIHQPRVRGVVITGTEHAFATGAEMDEIARLTPIAAHDFSLLGQRLMKMIERSQKPIVAAIRGYCFGGGLDLALGCHARVASEDARFAHPGGRLGILTGWGGTQRLPRLLGRARTLEMFCTGQVIPALEALAMGLINRIVEQDQVVQCSIQLAGEPEP
ncbi:MAG: enoyl-CoA hydratase/isomerase family protein [Candidatus Acidiferrales bacterium]